MVGFPLQRECCAVSSGITKVPSTRERESSNKVFHFLNSVSLVKMSVSLCWKIFDETENLQDTAYIYRKMSQEVHIKSLGIHFTKLGCTRGVKC